MAEKLTSEVRAKTIGYILTALGLVAGLAWNDAVRALIERFFPIEGGGVSVRFDYALLVTVVVVVVSSRLIRWSGKGG